MSSVVLAVQALPLAVMPEALRWPPVKRPAAVTVEPTRLAVLELPMTWHWEWCGGRW